MRKPFPLRPLLTFFSIWLLTGMVGIWLASADESIRIVHVLDVFTLVFTLLWLVCFRRDVLDIYRRFRVGWKFLILPLVVAYPAAFGIHVVVEGLIRAFHLDAVNFSRIFLDQGYDWNVIFLSICIVPAVVEEMAFRGVMQSMLLDTLRPVEAVLITAAAFSMVHFNLIMFVPLGLLGIYMGWLRQASGSIYPAMLAHFLHNFLVVMDERFGLFPL